MCLEPIIVFILINAFCNKKLIYLPRILDLLVVFTDWWGGIGFFQHLGDGSSIWGRLNWSTIQHINLLVSDLLGFWGQKHLELQSSNWCIKSTWHCPWKEGDGQWLGGSTGPTSNSGSIRCFPVAVLAPQLLDTPGPSPRAEGQPGGERGLGTQFWKKLILRDFILRRWRGSDVPDGGQRLPGVSPLCPGPTATF